MVTRAKQASKNLCNLIKEGIADELKGKDFWIQMREMSEAEGFSPAENIVGITYTGFYDEDRHLDTLKKVYNKHCKVRRRKT